jgi:hypothetical protein
MPAKANNKSFIQTFMPTSKKPALKGKTPHFFKKLMRLPPQLPLSGLHA